MDRINGVPLSLAAASGFTAALAETVAVDPSRWLVKSGLKRARLGDVGEERGQLGRWRGA